MKVLFLGDNLGGGSAVLGEQVLRDLSNSKKITKIYAVVNSRVNSPRLNKVTYLQFPKRIFFKLPKIIERILVLKKLEKNIVVFNMTNFPVGTRFIKPKKEIVLIHNAYFFTVPKDKNKISLFFYLREIFARRFVLKMMSYFSKTNITSFSVQSDFMFKLASRLRSRGFRVNKSSFHRPPSQVLVKDTKVKKNKWFYPASGEPHKNHVLLLKLFSSALKLNKNLKLYLTLRENDKSSKIILDKVDELKLKSFVINLGWLDLSSKDFEYATAEGIIFMSNFESLGLPMLEIIASKKRALVLRSELSEELFEKNYAYNLMSDNDSTKLSEHNRFIYSLANPHTLPKTKSKVKFEKNIAKAYFLSAYDQVS